MSTLQNTTASYATMTILDLQVKLLDESKTADSKIVLSSK